MKVHGDGFWLMSDPIQSFIDSRRPKYLRLIKNTDNALLGIYSVNDRRISSLTFCTVKVYFITLNIHYLPDKIRI